MVVKNPHSKWLFGETTTNYPPVISGCWGARKRPGHPVDFGHVSPCSKPHDITCQVFKFASMNVLRWDCMPDEYNQRLSGTYSDSISSWHHLGMASLILALWWWVELLWRSELPELSLLPLCLRLLFSSIFPTIFCRLTAMVMLFNSET